MEYLIKEEIPIIKLSGNILENQGEDLDETLSGLNFSSSYVIFDFTAVQQISSSFLSILVSFKEKLFAQKIEIILIVKNSQLMKLFEITMLDKVFKIYKNINDVFEEYI